MQVFRSEPLNSKHWCYVLTENRLFQHIISVWTSLNEFCVYAILPLATAISEGESVIQEALSQADNPHYSTVTCTAGTAMLLSTFIRNSWVACIWFEDVKFQMLTRSNSIFMLYLSEQFLLLFNVTVPQISSMVWLVPAWMPGLILHLLLLWVSGHVC